MSRQELYDKFKTLTSKVIGKESVKEIISKVEALDIIDDVRDLAALLSP